MKHVLSTQVNSAKSHSALKHNLPKTVFKMQKHLEPWCLTPDMRRKVWSTKIYNFTSCHQPHFTFGGLPPLNCPPMTWKIIKFCDAPNSGETLKLRPLFDPRSFTWYLKVKEKMWKILQMAHVGISWSSRQDAHFFTFPASSASST